jgi:predicted phage terminase large subunit-like protein
MNNIANESIDYKREALSKARLEQEKKSIFTSPHSLADLLGYEVAEHHSDILDFIERNDNLRSLILAPRGAGKSSIVTIAYVLWRLLKNPDLRILIVSNSQSQAAGFLREIKQHCERNKTLNFLFGNLIGDKWSETEIDLGIRKKFVKEANISAYGIFGALVGRHYDLIIMDDVVSQEIANSPTQRAKLEQWVGMSLMPTLEPGAQVIVIGTRYHNSDLYGLFIKNKYKDNFLQIKAVNDDGTSYWPTYFPMEILDETKEEVGTFIFNAQYQNDPHDMTGGLYKPEWFIQRWIQINENCISIPERAPVYYNELKITQGFDQAIGMKEIHDFNAHITIGQDLNTGEIYTLETVRKRLTFLERKALVIDQYKKWSRRTRKGVTAVAIEAIGFQDDLCQTIIREMPTLPIHRCIPRVDKFTRQTPVAALAENQKLILGQNQNHLYEELILFPGYDHDDLADALEMSIQALTKHLRVTNKPPGM